MKTTGYRYTLNYREACPHHFVQDLPDITYFATSLEFAKLGHVVPTVEGYDILKVEPNAEEIDANLFDMENRFRELETVQKHIAKDLKGTREDYEFHLKKAKTKEDRDMWHRFIELIDNDEEWGNRATCLKFHRFEGILGPDANLEYMADLAKELKAKGYDGYIVERLIVIFKDKK